MANLEHLDSVAVWVRDQAKAEEFYTRVLGLRVLERKPEVGWVAVAPAKGGTSIALLAPDPGSPDYDATRAQIGGNTGIGIETGNLKATLEGLRKRGAILTWANLDPEAAGGLHATVEDQDGNALMLFQPTTEATGRGGLERVSFVNVVVRDLRAARAFYESSLGLRAGDEIDTLAWAEVRCDARGAGVGLLQPVEETYEEPADYEEDMRHLGEPTGIAFLTRDLDACLAALRAGGVAVARGAEDRPGGGRMAEVADPDGNRFTVVEHPESLRRWEGVARAARRTAKPRRAAPKKEPAARTPKKKPAARTVKKKPPRARAKPARAAAKAKRPARRAPKRRRR